MRNKQSGFTLIEIAIVLVIIGLLLGGVLKGQELINSAKIKNLINDLNGVSTAVYAYQDRYRALPGDDPGATRWPQITAAGTGVGNGNGQIDTGTFNTAYVAAAAPETILFWTELRLAGLVSGNLTEGAPQNAVGGIMGVQHGAANGAANVGAARTQGFGNLVACQTNVLGKIAESMDRQLDDGVPNTGGVKAWTQGAVPVAVDGSTTPVDLTYTATGAAAALSPAAAYVDDGSTMYTVCKQIL